MNAGEWVPYPGESCPICGSTAEILCELRGDWVGKLVESNDNMRCPDCEKTGSIHFDHEQVYPAWDEDEEDDGEDS